MGNAQERLSVHGQRPQLQLVDDAYIQEQRKKLVSLDIYRLPKKTQSSVTIPSEVRRAKSYNIGLEQARLAEQGITPETGRASVVENLRAEIAERTETVNQFRYIVYSDDVTAKGYEHRGDMSATYDKSVEEAVCEQIARRFVLENEGYEAAKKEFFTLPLYSTVALFSPAPSVRIEGYPGYNLAYFYHILPGETEDTRTIKALSYINYFTNEEQAKILNKLMLSKDTVAPTEESILHSPVSVYGLSQDTNSFCQVWDEIGKVYNERNDRNFSYPPFANIEQYLLQGEEIWKTRHPELSQMMQEIAENIANNIPLDQWEKEWKIMLNFADSELLHIDITKTPAKEMAKHNLPYSDGTVFKYYDHLSFAPRIVATSCGESGSINPFADPIAELLTQAQFVTATVSVSDLVPTPSFLKLEEDGKGPREVPCQGCGHVNIRPYKGFVEECGRCNKSLRCE